MKISVMAVNVRGHRMYMVSWQPPGDKRKRLYRASRAAADAEAQSLRLKKQQADAAWLALSARQRDELIYLQADAEKRGFTLSAAFAFYVVNRTAAESKACLGEAFNRFMAEKKLGMLARKTLVALRSNVGRFINGREGASLDSISRANVMEWLTGKQLAPRTFNTYLTSLNTFFRWCQKVELIGKSPTASISKINERRMPDIDTPPAILSVAQTENLLLNTYWEDRGLLRFVAMQLFAGLRPEREAPKVGAEDMLPGFIRVKGMHAKDRQRRDVAIHPTLQAWLDIPGSEYHPKNLRRRWEKIRASAGLIRLEKVEGKARLQIFPTGWGQDCLRHTFASNCLVISGAEYTIKQLGHGDYDMLFGHYRALVSQAEAEKYWRLTPEQVLKKPTSAKPLVTATANLTKNIKVTFTPATL